MKDCERIEDWERRERGEDREQRTERGEDKGQRGESVED